jgi:hypothetical protein
MPEELEKELGKQEPLDEADKVSDKKPDDSKQKDKDKKEDDKTLDPEILESMLRTGENTDGMFTPKGEEEFEKPDEKSKLSIGKKVEPKGKYEAKFKNDMLKHPENYKVNTPRGEMTVAEAMREGYDPIVKRFSKEHGQKKIKDKYLSQLNDTDRASIEAITDPSAAQVAPADAEKFGLAPGSPMVKGQAPQAGGNPLAALMGGAPTPAAAPVGSPVPGAEESMAPGGQNPADIMSLLGGN